MDRRRRGFDMQRWVIRALLALATLMIVLLHLIAPNATDPVAARRAQAIALMATGLFLIWVVAAGGLMLRYRLAIVAWIRSIPMKWQVKFVAFAVALACLEEAVTVSMTNLAPLFGSPPQEAHITASTNYLDVVAFHSVVVFVPFFIALALLLTRWAFSPFAVFLGFGMVGTLAEAVFAANLFMLAAFPIWAFVYGLMVWLPASAVPTDRGARPVGPGFGLLLPVMIFVLALPMVAPIVWLIAIALGHPAIDFAP